MATGLISLVVGVGGQLLSSLFRPKQKDTYTFGPRVSDLNVPTVSPGNEINRVWGTMKVNTQYIWTSRLIETMHIAAQRAPGGKGGGKGGATSYTISYTYSVNTAIGICRGPVAQVNRIWAGGKLLWTNPNQVQFIQQEFDAAFYSEAQRLLDLGVPADQAYVSAYFFSYNIYMESGTLTIWSSSSAIAYIMTHTPIAADPTDQFYPNGYPAASYWDVWGIVMQLFDPVSLDKGYVPTPIRYDSIVVYNGDVWQEPDPTIQGAIGIGVVSGYRDLCYAVINNLQLADFGNTIPQFTAEVMKDGNVAYINNSIPAQPTLDITYTQAVNTYGNPPNPLSTAAAYSTGNWFLGALSAAQASGAPLAGSVGTAANLTVTNAVGTNVTLTGIINDILLESGLTSDDFDLSPMIPYDATFQGYAITQPTSTRQILQDLQKIFVFDGGESGYKIKFKTFNSTPVAILDRYDFAAHIDTETLPASVEQTRASELDMPRRLNLKYQEPERNYSMNTVWAERQVGKSLTIEDIDATIGMHRALAKQQIEAALVARFQMRNTYKVALPRKYIIFEFGDVVLVPNKYYPNHYNAWRVIEVAIGANGILEFTFVDSDVADQHITSVVGNDLDITIPTLQSSSRTYAYLLDIPPPSDIVPDGPQFFAVLTGAASGWKGGALLVDMANPGNAPAFGASSVVATQGSSWFQIADGRVQIPHGYALQTLDPSVSPAVWDNKSRVIVYLMNSQVTLSNADPVDMMSQALNTCYIGGEIVAFANADNLGNGKWLLTKFLRGLRGTDYAIEGHFGAEKFVMLEADSLERVIETQSALNVTATYVSLSPGETVANETQFSFTNSGNSLKPPVPAIIYKNTDNLGNVTIKWQPRNRYNGKWMNGSDITLDQATEAYSIDVVTVDVNGNDVVHATHSFGAVRIFNYTATAQFTDTGMQGAGIFLMIYQIGNIIGRGHPARVALG